MSVRALTDHINYSPGIFLHKAHWEEPTADERSEGTLSSILHCTNPRGMELSLNSFSTGEISAIMFDLAIARAEIAAQYKPTVLVVESDSLSMSKEFLGTYLAKLASPTTPFQTIVISTTMDSNQNWGGWQAVYFSRTSKEFGPHSKIAVGLL